MKEILHKGPGLIARILVRYRVVFFCLVAALAALSAFLIPYTNINSNMAKYLPDDYVMRQGLDVLEKDLPAMQEQLQTFGSVFADGNDLIPDDLPLALASGVALAIVVLLIMCSSVVEVFLFLVTIGFAVLLNMGSNALLPSVSMLTHMLSSILQMVLSMDYCIILMNRYRQEKQAGLAPVPAMENAVRNSSSTILSSAFTTIVSLLMLCFIKIKIGADMGVVLAKGVTISLICNFTVLPCLIVWFDKAIEKTRKKVPAISVAPLAAFETKFRIPLVLLFVGAFALFFVLQRRTPMTFAPKWDSVATSAGMEKNDLLLLYSDADSASIPALLDSLKTDPKVTLCFSYPSLLQRPLTASEMAGFTRNLTGQGGGLPENLPIASPDLSSTLQEFGGDDLSPMEQFLPIAYYAYSHPRRNETLTFDQIMAAVEELRAKGVTDRQIDISSLMESAMPVEGLFPPVSQAPETPPQADTVSSSPETVPETPEAASEEHPEAGGDQPFTEETPADEKPLSPKYGFTYEMATTPLTAAELAALTGQDKSKVALLYRMAGRAKQAMLPMELVLYVRDHILSDRRFASFIPNGAAAEIEIIRQELEAVLAAGPPRKENEEPAVNVEQAADGSPEPDIEEVADVEDQEPEKAPEDTPEPDLVQAEEDDAPPTPIERLAEMALSGYRYNSPTVYWALASAGIPVTRDEVDLLFLYCGAKEEADTVTRLTPEQFLFFVTDSLLRNPAVAPMVGDSLAGRLTDTRDMIISSASILRGNGYSVAVVMSDYDVETPDSFDYLDRTHARSRQALQNLHYWIGATEMYKELRDGFPSEVLLLTLLTVISIFLIVAFTFRSLFIPIPLVLTVLTGIYAEVWAVGAGGEPMYFLSYLIVQGILMGATIDYSILFTGYYLRSRRTMAVKESLVAAYDGSIHSILTSGLILVLVPFAMSFVMHDEMIISILKSISAGAATILLLILLVLPGVISALDRLVFRRKN